MLYFLSSTVPVVRSLCHVLVPMFVPRMKKAARCHRFESHSDSEFIPSNSAFYRHIGLFNWSSTDHVTDASLLVPRYPVPPYTHFIITSFHALSIR